MMHDERVPVNFIGVLFRNLYTSITSTHRSSQGSTAHDTRKCRVLRQLHRRAKPVDHQRNGEVRDLGRGDIWPKWSSAHRRVKTLAGEHC
jgi:hypothetical protein